MFVEAFGHGTIGVPFPDLHQLSDTEIKRQVLICHKIRDYTG
jgi:hypothetical protein